MSTARLAFAPLATRRPGPAALATRLAALMVAADARHRERRRLAEMPPERLRDMGMPRATARPASGSLYG